jgi:5-methyltetrahydrofolate--homocysteine methyltransferase
LRVLPDFQIETLRELIDWSPFFQTWELRGKFPKILDDPDVGSEAQKLYDDAQRLLNEIISNKMLAARGVYGFWPANSDRDDIILYADRDRNTELTRFPMLRQQWKRKGQTEFRSLADYIAPIDSGRSDFIGAFAVTTGIGAAELAQRFEDEDDPYQSIMVKSLADRLAEAFAEYLHKQARIDWSFGNQESLTHEELISEQYRGIRPAFGYPACPDHTRKRQLFELLDAENNAGIELTESFAMWPGAAVSGLYFSHPAARYFSVDRIMKDQIEDYSKRANMTVAETERWMMPNLSYEAA